MQELRPHLSIGQRLFRIGVPAAFAAIICYFLRGIVLDLMLIVFGAAVVAFLVEPLARFYERKLPRNPAALLAIGSVLGGLLAALWLLLPALIREITELGRVLPESIELVKGMLNRLTAWVQTHLPGMTLPLPSLADVKAPDLAGTLNFAGGIADVFYRLSLMIVLGYFLLCDRTRLMIRLELLSPLSMRKTAVRMGNAVCRELKLYLRGQGMISIAVGALSAVGLALAGVPSSLVLGMFVGILNMIPYFGPILGGIPAILLALGQGWQTALWAFGVLWLVQQLDSAFISPRILGNLTGLSPAMVLLAIFAGSHFSGIVGMLLALPLLMTIRTVFRVFVQRHENV